jgi:cation diffusion facilitator CzcD-associated flavoprotein CzcO
MLDARACSKHWRHLARQHLPWLRMRYSFGAVFVFVRPESALDTNLSAASRDRSYLLHVFNAFELTPVTRFNIDVIESRFDEARSSWSVTAKTPHGLHRFESRHLIMATGPLNKPSIPEIDGRSTFVGPQFHSMNWRHDVDLLERNVTVIGTGASAI